MNVKNREIEEIPIEEKVFFLKNSITYPERPELIEVKETHMSWVFLTEKYVYKLKKPVKYPFLDFSTIDLRKINCEEEVRLNRRLARDTYKGVVPLTFHKDKGLQLEGKGRIIDWLVKMERLPEKSMLNRKIEENTIGKDEVIQIGNLLAEFYKDQKDGRLDPEEYFNKLRSSIVSNLTELKKSVFKLSEKKIDILLNALLKFISDQSDVFKSRSLKTVEGHGDLKPEHICIQEIPLIIDRLEFNPQLRFLDPLEELSFLAMECEVLKAKWVGDLIIKVYEEETEDNTSSNLISFYKSIRAVQRAVSSYRHILEPRYKKEIKWLIKGEVYFNLADEYRKSIKP